jgi:hypothetical protein
VYEKGILGASQQAAKREPVTCRLAVAQRVGMIRTNPNHEATKVIDNQDQTERLLRKLTEVLPLSALATPPLMANLRGRSSAAEITMNCKVTSVFYLGDEGGITCQVTFDEKKEEVFLVSITHLAFDRRLAIAREIAAYQKRRIKRIRRDSATDSRATYH